MKTEFEKFQERLRNNDIAGASDAAIATADKAKKDLDYKAMAAEGLSGMKTKKPVKKKTLDEPAPRKSYPYGYFEMDGKKYENEGSGWFEILPDGRKKRFYRE